MLDLREAYDGLTRLRLTVNRILAHYSENINDMVEDVIPAESQSHYNQPYKCLNDERYTSCNQPIANNATMKRTSPTAKTETERTARTALNCF